MQQYIQKYGEKTILAEIDHEEKETQINRHSIQKFYDRISHDEKTSLDNTSLGRRFIQYEYQKLNSNILEWLTTWLQPKRGVKPAYVDLIQEMVTIYHEKETVADILTLATINTTLNQCVKSINISNAIITQIAKNIEEEVKLTQFIQEHQEEKIPTFKGLDKRVQQHYKLTYLSKIYKKNKFQKIRWNKETRLTLSQTLLNLYLDKSNMIEEILIDNIPHIIPTTHFLEAWKQNIDKIKMNTYGTPLTLIPPMEWTDQNSGGYYTKNKQTLIRLREYTNTSFLTSYLKRLEEIEIPTVLTAVNSIQNTPWKINKKVLQVAEKIIELGGGRAGIPFMQEAPHPTTLPLNPTETEIKAYKKKMVVYYRSEKRRRSIQLRTLSTINTAKNYAEYDRFFVPHNMDFRGRIYPIPLFNFQGDELTKGLLEFADTPAIPTNDPKYLEYFYIEGSNRAGIDKVSFADRIQWIKDHQDLILATAQDPLGNLWWQDLDSPFQFLGFCYEFFNLTIFLKNNNNSIKGFKTGLVCSYDGTCSGLQHYSALLRDPIGGKAVNLLPSDKPNDIYKIVADKVNQHIENDCQNGTLDEEKEDKKGEKYIKLGTRSLALIWNTYGVTRKVTKRSVMTLAYGSREYGFKEQILEDIIKPDIYHNDTASIFDGCQSQSAQYLAKLIWNAVQTTVVKAVEGMQWLQECASQVTKQGEVVTWWTPAEMPIQQQYMEYRVKKVRLRCAGKRTYLYYPDETGNIDKRHQRSGIAPNFIHSLDASHLQLTVKACHNQGIEHFAMVHDSYGTCLAHAPIMYRIVREEFVKMYENNDILEDIRSHLQVLIKKPLPPPPSKGTLNLQEILKSPYIFC